MFKAGFQIECFGISDVGIIREHNEDVWAAYPEQGLFIIADGMGGHLAGEIAAKQSIESLYMYFKKWKPTKQTTPEEGCHFFREAFLKVNELVYNQGQSKEVLHGMGTTLCTLYFLNTYAIIAHVGDSRIYLWREQQLKQLTEDHSLLAELLALGAMKPEDSQAFPYKHILTRAIGTHPHVEPTVNSLTIQPHDLFLLCSDGLTNYISDTEISRILNYSHSLTKKGQQLIDLANEHGGGDNITSVLVSMSDDLSGQ